MKKIFSLILLIIVFVVISCSGPSKESIKYFDNQLNIIETLKPGDVFLITCSSLAPCNVVDLFFPPWPALTFVFVLVSCLVCVKRGVLGARR